MRSQRWQVLLSATAPPPPLVVKREASMTKLGALYRIS